MSEELNTQTATEEANAGATPPAEASGAPAKPSDDLDALLEQYRKETGSTGTQAAPAAAPPPAADVVPRSEFEALKAQVTQKQMQEEAEQLAKGVRAAGDLPDFLSDDDIIGIIDRRATVDPALRKAWVDTAGSPKARAKLIEKLGEELGRKFANAKGVDQQATADREAVAASVRGSSTKAPEGKAPDFSKMTDNQFRKEVEEKYGFSPF